MKSPSLGAVLVAAAAGYGVAKVIEQQVGACYTWQCTLAGALLPFFAQHEAVRFATILGF